MTSRRPVPRQIPATSRKAADSISAVGGPTHRGLETPWPIGDLYHARLALIYALSPSHEKVQRRVLRAVAENYPEYDWESWWNPRAERLGAPPWGSFFGGKKNPKKEEPLSFVKPYITSAKIMGRIYDLHDDQDHNRGDCRSCAGTGIWFNNRHTATPECQDCEGTGGKRASIYAIQSILVVPPCIQGESIFFPTGIPFKRVLDSWRGGVGPPSSFLMKSILVDEYPVFTETEFRAYTPDAQTPQSDRIRARYFDWQKNMEQALTELARQNKIRPRLPKI